MQYISYPSLMWAVLGLKSNQPVSLITTYYEISEHILHLPNDRYETRGADILQH
jgi:hypothetical protein